MVDWEFDTSADMLLDNPHFSVYLTVLRLAPYKAGPGDAGISARLIVTAWLMVNCECNMLGKV
jgi:hypothetical protein